tara:strand:- start:56 stop:520 length:465 start_codon:yes stop_codon:yes gene_type:complete
MKKLMVIGGGKWQIPLIKKIKAMGHYAICSNLYPNSPAFEYADESYVVDILDIKKNYEIAKSLNVDGILSDQTDIAVKTVANISEKLGINSIGRNASELYTDKSLMREKLQVPNLNHPKSLLLNSLKEIESFSNDFIKFPFILNSINNIKLIRN